MAGQQIPGRVRVRAPDVGGGLLSGFLPAARGTTTDSQSAGRPVPAAENPC